MYLNYLSQEAKGAFWNLALNLIQDEGGIKDEEQQMMLSYQQEMGISDAGSLRLESVDEAIGKLLAETDATKRIVFFELLALANVDSDYSEDEREKMDFLQKSLGLSSETIRELESILHEIFHVYAKAAKVILGTA